MVTLVHISSGQPARGTELAALLWRNTANGERNLFVSRGTLMLLRRYAKTRNAVGDQYVQWFLDLDTAETRRTRPGAWATALSPPRHPTFPRATQRSSA